MWKVMEPELKQLQLESDSWKQSIGYMMEENISLKNRLTEILRNRFNSTLLEQAEYFQNRFIKEDERIGLIRDDVVQIDRSLMMHAEENSEVDSETDYKIKKLRNYILHAQKQFIELKSEFNNYLL
jgi:hypothetical protein